MVQLSPNIPDEAWKFSLEMCDVKPDEPIEEKKTRIIIIHFIREAFVDFINQKAEKKGSKKRLVITGKSHNKIVLINTENLK